MMEAIKVGDTFFVYDENRRVYDKSRDGMPIYREYFRPIKITGETSRSWLIDYWDAKVPKNNPWKVLHTAAMVDEKVWANDHRYKVVRLVERCSVADLRKIAEIVGYSAA